MSKKRIMLVDDEVGFTRLLHLVLPAYEICEVNDSTRTLETARTFKPDLIFLDVIMPEADGGTVAALLRADPALRHVPIVFLTAIVSEKEGGHMIGGFPFISKPVSLQAITECIDKHLGGK